MLGIFSTILIPISILALAIHYHPAWTWYTGHFLNERLAKYLLITLGIYLAVNILICLVALSKYKSYEVWNFKVVSVHHQEKWTTHETRVETYQSGTDSKGNPEYSTRIVNYTQEHGPYWTARDEYGKNFSITPSVYSSWAKRWGNEKHIGDNIGDAAGWDKAITGKIYEAKWTGKFEDIFPESTIHTYTNKIRVSETLFKQKRVSKEAKKKYVRPADLLIDDPIITYDDISHSPSLQWKLRLLNASLGKQYQIHCLFVLMDGSSPAKVADEVIAAWGGPNKNELCIFVGMKGENIKWVRVYSWMDDTTIHNELRSEISKLGRLDPDKTVALLDTNIKKYWNRKEFADFDYIKMRVGANWIILSAVLMLIGSATTYFGINYIEDSSHYSGR